MVGVLKPVTINGNVIVLCLLFMVTYIIIGKKGPDIAKWSMKTRQHLMYIFVLLYPRFRKARYCNSNIIYNVERKNYIIPYRRTVIINNVIDIIYQHLINRLVLSIHDEFTSSTKVYHNNPNLAKEHISVI